VKRNADIGLFTEPSKFKVEMGQYDLLEKMILMVGVAQLVEHQVVALRVVGSSPITHPIKIKRRCIAAAFCATLRWPFCLNFHQVKMCAHPPAA
jgi:hypothetical protein